MTEHSLVELSEPLFDEQPDGTFAAPTGSYRWRCRCGVTAEAGSADAIKRLAFAHIPPANPQKGDE